MIAFMKAPIAAILIAGAVAILPTAIVAHLAAPPDQPSEPATNNSTNNSADNSANNSANSQDTPANTSADFSEPTTRPARPGTLSAPGALANEARNRLGALGRRPDATTTDEMQAAVDFFTANSPNRMAYFSRLPLNSPRRHRQTLAMVQLYRPILNFKESNPQLYELLVLQVKLRDDAFELAKNGKTAALREKAAQIVTTSIQARTLRLNILKKALADQQAKLDNDQANQDLAIEREATEITTEEQRLMNAVDQGKKRERGQSMIDVDPSNDPLAEVGPISNDSADLGS